MTRGIMKLTEELENFDYLRRPIKAADREPGEIPYLGASGQVDSVASFTHDGVFLCVSEDGENLRSRKSPLAWVQQGRFWANNHLHVLGGASPSRLRFFAGALACLDISGYITGSAQPKLSQASLDRIEIPRHSAEEQEAIGGLLGALDGKIAANKAVIRAVDVYTQAVAQTPSKWTALSDLASIRRNSVAPENFSSDHVYHYSIPAFDAGAAKLERAADIKSAKLRIENPCVLISKLNPRIMRVWPVGKLPDAPALASTEFIVLEPRSSVTVATLAGAMYSPIFARSVQTLVAGTTGSHQRVKAENVIRLQLRDVRQLTSETREQLENLGRRSALASSENTILAATRDELLPLLMSGKITFRDAKKRLEEEA